MRELTDKPFGVNIAQAFVRDPGIVDFVVEQGVKFVTTSAGDPTKYTHGAQGGRAHRVPRRADAARRAEGGRRGRRRARRRGRRGRRLQEPPRRRRRWCCCRSCARRWTCRSSRRAASATARRWRPRSRSAPRACRWARAWCRRWSRRSTTNWKQRDRRRRRDRHGVAATAAKGPALRALRTERTRAPRARPTATRCPSSAPACPDVYFEGDIEAGVALSGQVAGRIEEVAARSPRSSARTVAEFFTTTKRLQAP